MAEPAASSGPDLPLAWRAPADYLAAIDQQPGVLLLSGGDGTPRGRFSYLTAFPAAFIHMPGEPDPLEPLRTARQLYPQAWIGGLLSYDLAGRFEALPPVDGPVTPWPEMALGVYEAIAVFDHQTGRAVIRGEPGAAARLQAGLLAPAPARTDTALLAPLEPVWSEARYLAAARTARNYVRAGDVFQVNLSHRFGARIQGAQAPLAVLKALASTSPAPFAVYARVDDERVVVSNSPERFWSLDADGRVETRPIKGTRPRGSDPASDAALAAELHASAKDRAENLMIVDLMRNDLSRVCVPGSVSVPELFSVESFANVHHLVSAVTGRLAPDRDVFDLLTASFPPGSITGAPKVRAMEIIAELEGEARGPYCGAAGLISPDGSARFNVMIRTAGFVADGDGWQVEARSGGAITIDSEPESELAETHSKIAMLKRAMQAAGRT
ncbi:anthranilate synthase component I family protein [Synechococcus moorigangaii CMS01]|nr:anthranilate synthase component I family protein [Synechococcus moorigangaii CMS01]